MQDWYWHQRSLPPQFTGAQVWQILFGTEPITVLLESPTTISSKISRYSIAAGKPRQVWTPAVGEILPCLQSLVKRASSANSSPSLNTLDISNLPFTGGYVGWLGYDLAWEIEKLPYLKRDRLPFPVAFWYEPENFAVVDHQSNAVWLAASHKAQLEEMIRQLEQGITNLKAGTPSTFVKTLAHTAELSLSPDAAAYQAMVSAAKLHIQAGDIFQTNLSLRFSLERAVSGWDLYQHLQGINPSPFASYWRTLWGEVISVSPERLVQVCNDHVETRPIAGTRRRGSSSVEDLALESELIASTKEQAEHIMLVDLERNDLGRVCEYGSVVVDELLTVERYSHVMHIVSNVVGKLSPEKSLVDVIKSVFPGGTITGCPKVRCMEIIEKLEPERRSLFYGSCGYIDRRGHADLNILIRTLLKCRDLNEAESKEYIFGQVGAGIVADSIPEMEWKESLQKAKAQLAALGVVL